MMNYRECFAWLADNGGTFTLRDIDPPRTDDRDVDEWKERTVCVSVRVGDWRSRHYISKEAIKQAQPDVIELSLCRMCAEIKAKVNNGSPDVR